MGVEKEAVLNALTNVIEPDLKKDIIELGLVSDVKINGNNVSFTVKVSNPAMHSRARMKEACEFAIERVLGKEVELEINVVGLPKNRNPELKKVLPSVKNMIAIASGKGGVGKSTITANIAVGLAKKGYKVGLIDADIYGPSVPLMFDLTYDKPKMIERDGRKYIEPLEGYGVKVLSIGFFAEVSQAIIWRGAMATKAINQLIKDAWWGELDYLLFDLPPGTGDIHLSIVQAIPLTGVVIVSTPQEIALADARKGINMFKLDSINVPVVGIVENMAWFTPEELPENKYYIFGKGGAQQLSAQMGIPFLGQVPLVQSIREAGDAGRPAILQETTETAKAFSSVIDKFVVQVDWRNEKFEPTKIVNITQG